MCLCLAIGQTTDLNIYFFQFNDYVVLALSFFALVYKRFVESTTILKGATKVNGLIQIFYFSLFRFADNLGLYSLSEKTRIIIKNWTVD